MFARIAAAALLLAGCAPAPAPVAVPPSDGGGSALAAACAGRDGWSDAAPPARIFANVYQVGTCGISALLVTGDAGHVLIDGATADAAPGILAKIARLGFRARDVKLILNGHEHLDHAGGFAALKAATGARLLVRAPARAALEKGADQPGDPQLGLNPGFPPVAVDGEVADGETLRLGNLALTAVATPGHTPGSTSWRWRSCEGERCLSIVYADSLTALSADGWRFSARPDYVAAYRAALDRVATLPCDVLVTPHPQASDLFERLSGKAPLVDPAACRRYADAARLRLDARLAKEGAR